MKKIYFKQLMVEVTRRCQLKCEHCMRGEAQNLEISTEVIDTFLEQAAGIGDLFFTGGEPTLATDKMDYFLDRMIEKEIPLGGISYITNGVELTDETRAFLCKALAYITKSREENEIFKSDCQIYFQPRIRIGLSVDDFHGGNIKIKQEYEKLLPADSCFVSFVNNNIPVKIGRGKNLKEGISRSKKNIKQQIGMEYESHRLICEDAPRSKAILRYCDAFIPCFLELTAIGKIFQMLEEYDYLESDSDVSKNYLICQFTDGDFPSIFDSVIEFNKGRKPCYIASQIPMPTLVENLRTEMKYKKVHDIDTNEQNWACEYDKIFRSDIIAAKTEIEHSNAQYLGKYGDYLNGRIPHYSDMEEIKKDFPHCNRHFCKELQEIIKQCTVSDIVEWIITSKDLIWYSVDDALFEYTKHLYNQFYMEQYKAKVKKMSQEVKDAESKMIMKKRLLKSVQKKLVK